MASTVILDSLLITTHWN